MEVSEDREKMGKGSQPVAPSRHQTYRGSEMQPPTTPVRAFSVFLTVAVLALLARPAHANHEVILSTSDGLDCVTVTFEGGGQFEQRRLDD